MRSPFFETVYSDGSKSDYSNEGEVGPCRLLFKCTTFSFLLSQKFPLIMPSILSAFTTLSVKLHLSTYSDCSSSLLLWRNWVHVREVHFVDYWIPGASLRLSSLNTFCQSLNHETRLL